METVSTHPSRDHLSDFGLGRLDDAGATAVARHLADCPACSAWLEKQPPDRLVALLLEGHRFAPADVTRLPETHSDVDLTPGTPLVTADVPPGLVDHPRYRVVRLLGKGGMGAVYLAEHKVMGTLRALKVVAPEIASNPVSADQFRREIQTAARLDHPNIVRAYDAEQSGQTHFLVMEYVEGVDLADLVEQRGPLPVAHACHFIRQAALGLQHAHEHGMVHRDIKPQNLILARKNVVKILDFGLAKVASEAATEPGCRTRVGAVLGTPDYMAPEQWDDARTADIRADVYSLGCTLYALLAGAPPFHEAPGPLQKMAAHVQRSPCPLGEVLRSDVPARLAALVARMLAKSPSERPQTPAEVARALEPFIPTGNPQPQPAVAKPVKDADSAAIGLEPVPAPRVRQRPRRRPAKRPKRSRVVAIAVASVVIGAALAAALMPPVKWSEGIPEGKNQPKPIRLDSDPRRPVAQRPVAALHLEAPGPVTLRMGDEATLTVKVRREHYPDRVNLTFKGLPAGVKASPDFLEAGANSASLTLTAEATATADFYRVVVSARGGGQTDTKEFTLTLTPAVPRLRRPEPLDCTGPNGASPAEVRTAQEIWAKYLGREEVEQEVEVGGGVKMIFVLVPPGKFRMGSPRSEQDDLTKTHFGGKRPDWLDYETEHTVTLTEPFDLGKFEVTQAEYQALIGTNPSLPTKRPRLPVENVSWEDADAFGRVMTRRSKDYDYRLPTEAEWEYACRGGRPDSQPFGIGRDRALRADEANFGGSLKKTYEVGLDKGNALGLCDMHGNVWEWCYDWYDRYPTAAVTMDPPGPSKGQLRVGRGGCFDSSAMECRCASRRANIPGLKNKWVGFRLARSVRSGGK